jgi:fructose-1-phosphate kinase PfkB-like protein
MAEPADCETRTCLTIVGQSGRQITEIREDGPIVQPATARQLLDRFDGWNE